MSTLTRRTGLTRRTRMFAAAALTAAALTLTACSDGEGVQDEGSSEVAANASTSASAASPKENGGTSSGAGQSDQVGSTSGGSTGGKAGSSGTSGSKGASGSTGSSGSKDSGPTRTPCSSSSTRVTATEVSRPLNHILLTVTNTGSKNCNLIDYPVVRFGGAQSVPPVFEDSKPQAVVTLAPGESGYAGVLLSAGDDSGSNGYTATSLKVSFNDGAGAATPSLPANGVYVDNSLQVTYWQSTMADALTW